MFPFCLHDFPHNKVIINHCIPPLTLWTKHICPDSQHCCQRNGFFSILTKQAVLFLVSARFFFFNISETLPVKYSSLACLAKEMFMAQSTAGRMPQTLDFIFPDDTYWKHLMNGRQTFQWLISVNEELFKTCSGEGDIRS